MESPSHDYMERAKSKLESEIKEAEQTLNNIETQARELYMKKVVSGDTSVEEQLNNRLAEIVTYQRIVMKKKQNLEEFEKRYSEWGDKEYKKIDEGWNNYLVQMKKITETASNNPQQIIQIMREKHPSE
jgi:hypothetical protein